MGLETGGLRLQSFLASVFLLAKEIENIFKESS